MKVANVEKVQTPDPQSFSDGDRVTITVRLLLLIAAKVRRYSSAFSPREVLKVGQRRKLFTYATISTGAVLADEELPKNVKVELNATYRDGHFVELEPITVSLDDEGLYGTLVSSLMESP